jgi:hypothetical protein
MISEAENIIGNGGNGLSGNVVDDASGTVSVSEKNQERFSPVKNSLADETNETATTHYYPGPDGKSMFGFKDLSISGKLSVTTGTISIWLETFDDEDLVGGDWQPCNGAGYDHVSGSYQNVITVTNGTIQFKWDFDELNCDRYRVKMTTSSATNTVIVKERVKA